MCSSLCSDESSSARVELSGYQFVKDQKMAGSASSTMAANPKMLLLKFGKSEWCCVCLYIHACALVCTQIHMCYLKPAT